MHAAPPVAAGQHPCPECQHALKCPRCSSCGSSLRGEGSGPSATHHVPELISQRPMCYGPSGCQSLLCNPKPSQVSGKLCLDRQPLPARLSPFALHTRRLAPRGSRRSCSPRITLTENVALCLLNESLRPIDLLFIFFSPKQRMHYLELVCALFG